MPARRLITLFACACAGAWLSAGAAAAQAPIVYAGQGTQTASSGDDLAGGGERSYGYGARQSRSGATIDVRRSQRAPAPPATVANLETPASPTEWQAAEQRPNWLEEERVGPPYEVSGRWYVPTPEPGYQQTGTASWYGADFHGRPTASGELFDSEALTAAHPTLPIPSLVQVTNLENGREVIVRVNDRGPFVGERLIDVSRRTAEVLGFEEAGHARVHVRYLGPAPRRVGADGAPAPASTRVPAAPAANEPPEQGPRSLLPPPAPETDYALAGAPEEPAPRYVEVTQRHAAPLDGGYVVQVGAFADLSNAHRVRAALAGAGPVSVDVRQTASGELFRVRVGPWASREEAEAARRMVASLGYPDAVVAAR